MNVMVCGLPDEQWTTADAAAAVGLTVEGLRSLRKRGGFPTPDGWLGGIPWWWKSTVTGWLEQPRRGRGRPPKEEELK